MSGFMQKKKAIVIHLVPHLLPKGIEEIKLHEFLDLVNTLQESDVIRIFQRKSQPDRNIYVGSGKMDEIRRIVSSEKVNTIMINDIVRPTQLFNIKRYLWNTNSHIQVWDRIDLILAIFEKNASSSEAKLQIELAKMKHMGPRMYGLGYELSRQGGGIGTRGIGETNIERMKRHWRNAIRETEKKLDLIVSKRSSQMTRRKQNGVKTISLVGYTNAGKSTLFNQLTRKKTYVDSNVFATLDSKTGKIYLSNIGKDTLVTDTIGFINHLPPQVVSAFKSTLLESISADLLVHVIDASDPHMLDKIHTVEQILDSLHLDKKNIIYVFNKIEVTKSLPIHLMQIYKDYSPSFISAKEDINVRSLKSKMYQQLYPKK